MRLCPIALALALTGAGCVAENPYTRCDDCDGTDAGAAIPDASAGLSVDGSSTIDAGAMPPAAELDSDCSNGVDDNLDGRSDCAESSCSAVPYCCLGQSRRECCAPAETVSVDFTACPGTDPEACGAELAGFGQPSAILEGAALVPNGGDSSDAGLVLGGTLNALRDRITVSARIAATPGGCDDCLDAIGIAVGDAVSGTAVSVHPDVAVLVRPMRGDLALIVADEVIATLPIADAEAHDYALEVAPDGEVTVTIDTAIALRATWMPRADRRAIVYGRTHNRPAGSPPPARALEVGLSTSACEIPSALAREGAPIELGAGDARSPSAASSSDGALLVALESGGDIFLASPNGDGWTTSLALDAPEAEAYRDPELVLDGDRWLLYVTREHDGTVSIARAESASGTFMTPVDLDAPAPLSAPSVVQWGGTLVAAVTEVAGVSRIVLLDATGDALSWHGGSLEAATVEEPRGGILAFDADEVSGPALFVDGAGLLRLYYAGRRGTRWSAGMIASADGRTFSAPSDAPVLSPSGSGFDALAVTDPSIVRTSDALAIFYGASDGTTHTIGRALGGTRW